LIRAVAAFRLCLAPAAAAARANQSIERRGNGGQFGHVLATGESTIEPTDDNRRGQRTPTTTLHKKRFHAATDLGPPPSRAGLCV
jgi:hypothetical protein